MLHSSTEKLKREFERLARERQQTDIENLVNSKGLISVQLDARKLFLPSMSPSPTTMPSRRKKINNDPVQVSAYQIRHSFSVPVELPNLFRIILRREPLAYGTDAGDQQDEIPPATTFVASAFAAFSGQGRPAANVVGTIKHQFSPKLFSEFSTLVFAPNRVFSAKTTYVFNQYLAAISTLQFYSLKAPPQAVLSLNRQVSRQGTCSLQFSSGAWSLFGWGANETRQNLSSMTVQYSRNGPTYGTPAFETFVTASPENFLIGGRYVVQTGKHEDDVVLESGVTLSLAEGAEVNLGASRKVTEHTKLRVVAGLGLTGASSIKFEWKRLGQKVSIPVRLSDSWNNDSLVWGLLMPCAMIFVADFVVYRPYRRAIKEQEIEQRRVDRADVLENRKRDALNAQKLMKDTVKRNQEIQRKNAGLVILSAIYGDQSNKDRQADVTIAVASCVTSSGQLHFPEGVAKSNLIGFWDPCYGHKKTLVIRYEFKHELHEVSVADKTAVSLPMREHRVDRNVA